MFLQSLIVFLSLCEVPRGHQGHLLEPHHSLSTDQQVPIDKMKTVWCRYRYNLIPRVGTYTSSTHSQANELYLS